MATLLCKVKTASTSILKAHTEKNVITAQLKATSQWELLSHHQVPSGNLAPKDPQILLG